MSKSSARSVAAFMTGLIFGLGLVIGGMTQPSKVVAFLDFFGNWDPSLAFVMGGAVAVHLVAFRLIMKRKSPFLEDLFQVPTRRDLTPQLVIGSALFGIGWGLGGFCPGPGLTALPALSPEAITFVISMAIGMMLHALMERAQTRARHRAA